MTTFEKEYISYTFGKMMNPDRAATWEHFGEDKMFEYLQAHKNAVVTLQDGQDVNVVRSNSICKTGRNNPCIIRAGIGHKKFGRSRKRLFFQVNDRFGPDGSCPFGAREKDLQQAGKETFSTIFLTLFTVTLEQQGSFDYSLELVDIHQDLPIEDPKRFRQFTIVKFHEGKKEKEDSREGKGKRGRDEEEEWIEAHESASDGGSNKALSEKDDMRHTTPPKKRNSELDLSGSEVSDVRDGVARKPVQKMYTLDEMMNMADFLAEKKAHEKAEEMALKSETIQKVERDLRTQTAKFQQDLEIGVGAALTEYKFLEDARVKEAVEKAEKEKKEQLEAQFAARMADFTDERQKLMEKYKSEINARMMALGADRAVKSLLANENSKNYAIVLDRAVAHLEKDPEVRKMAASIIASKQAAVARDPSVYLKPPVSPAAQAAQLMKVPAAEDVVFGIIAPLKAAAPPKPPSPNPK